ncbi:unnamed protein product, partial [Cyprideis torosa]
MAETKMDIAEPSLETPRSESETAVKEAAKTTDDTATTGHQPNRRTKRKSPKTKKVGDDRSRDALDLDIKIRRGTQKASQRYEFVAGFYDGRYSGEAFKLNRFSLYEHEDALPGHQGGKNFSNTIHRSYCLKIFHQSQLLILLSRIGAESVLLKVVRDCESSAGVFQLRLHCPSENFELLLGEAPTRNGDFYRVDIQEATLPFIQRGQANGDRLLTSVNAGMVSPGGSG